MEPTFAENAAANARGEAESSSGHLGLSFAALADAWARSGASVPVAIVGSIFDDVLGDELSLSLPREGGTLKFEDVVIDPNGVARLLHAERASVEAIAVLVVRALGEDAPLSALPVLSKFSAIGARDAEELRVWVREAIEAVATHDEVASAMSACSVPPDSIDIPAITDAPLGTASAALDFLDPRDQPTEIIRARSPSLPSFQTFSKPAEPEIPILSAIPAPVPDDRPVIRHVLTQPSVRVNSAPAARRSAKPVADPRDALKIPSDRPHWGAWLFVILLLVVGALFWLRYL